MPSGLPFVRPPPKQASIALQRPQRQHDPKAHTHSKTHGRHHLISLHYIAPLRHCVVSRSCVTSLRHAFTSLHCVAPLCRVGASRLNGRQHVAYYPLADRRDEKRFRLARDHLRLHIACIMTAWAQYHGSTHRQRRRQRSCSCSQGAGCAGRAIRRGGAPQDPRRGSSAREQGRLLRGRPPAPHQTTPGPSGHHRTAAAGSQS